VAVSKRLVEGKREEVKAGEGENADAEAANNREAVSFIVTAMEEESEKETADQQGHQPSILLFVLNIHCVYECVAVCGAKWRIWKCFRRETHKHKCACVGNFKLKLYERRRIPDSIVNPVTVHAVPYSIT
jgi:hypothetical protein